MISKYQRNQHLLSSDSTQSLPKINKKNQNIKVGNQSMVTKSLSKQSKSSSMSQSVTVAIENISQLILFMMNAKIQPDKQVSIIDSLKLYLVQLKQHLKSNLIVIKPNSLNKNYMSQLNLNLNTKNIETSQIKNLNSQKYPNKILTPIENYSGILNEKSGVNKIPKQIHKTPYFNKALLPSINKKVSLTDNKKEQSNVKNIKQQKMDSMVVQKKQNQNLIKKDNIKKSITLQKPLQQKKRSLRIKTQMQRDEKSIVEQQKIQKVDPMNVIERLKQKICSHQLLLQKLKQKVKECEQVAIKDKNIIQKSNDTIEKNSDEIEKISDEIGKISDIINKDDEKKIITQKVENKKLKQISDQKKLNNEQLSNDNSSKQISQIDILKAQLQTRQQEIVNLWVLINNLQFSLKSVD